MWYQRVVNLGFRKPRPHLTRLIIVRAPPGHGFSACERRAYLGRLVEKLGDLRPVSIVLDYAFVPRDDCNTETQNLQTAIDTVGKRIPVLIGRYSWTQQELEDSRQTDLQKKLEPDHFSRKDQVMARSDIKTPYLAGLDRLDCDTRRIPVMWRGRIFDQNGTVVKSEDAPTLCLVVARTYDNQLTDQLARARRHSQNPLTSFISEEQFKPIDAGVILSGSMARNAWNLAGKILVVGDEVGDIHESVIGRVPGVVLQANYIESLLDYRYFFTLGRVTGLLGTIACLLLVFSIFEMSQWALWKSFALSVVGLVVLLLVSYIGAVVRSALDRAAYARASASRRFTHRRVTHAPSNPRFRRTLEIAAPLAFLAATLLIATHPFAPSLHPRRLEITVLDVGQGDSIFVAFPDATTMLIDGGGEPGSQFANDHVGATNIGEEVVAPYLWSRGLKKIDVMVLTHAHHDHLDGLHAILDDFQVNELWVGLDVQAQAYKDLIEHAGRVGTRVIHRRDPEAYRFAQVRGTVLWPLDEHTVPQPTNNDSLVMRLTDGKFSFMLPGDAEQKVEKNLTETGQLLNADFLKVPHHGSKTSSTDEFLNAVSPRVAVISVGEGNSFGHPAPIVVDRYRQRGIRLLRTDQDGAVTALTDGDSLQVSTYREEHPAN